MGYPQISKHKKTQKQYTSTGTKATKKKLFFKKKGEKKNIPLKKSSKAFLRNPIVNKYIFLNVLYQVNDLNK